MFTIWLSGNIKIGTLSTYFCFNSNILAQVPQRVACLVIAGVLLAGGDTQLHHLGPHLLRHVRLLHQRHTAVNDATNRPGGITPVTSQARNILNNMRVPWFYLHCIGLCSALLIRTLRNKCLHADDNLMLNPSYYKLSLKDDAISIMFINSCGKCS